MSDPILEHIGDEFPFEPTNEQCGLMQKLSHFIHPDNKDEVFILRGYAGTGKTTMLGALTRALKKMKRKTILMAPTGRAAKVLQQKTRKSAFTIHKIIYAPAVDKKGVTHFKLKANKGKGTIYIVDEASMIHDKALETSGFSGNHVLEDLVSFMLKGQACKIILVGDPAQLPPVGLDSSPALDATYIRQSYFLDVVEFELQEVQRQAQHSGILFNATSLRNRIQEGLIGEPSFENARFEDFIPHFEGSELEYALQQSYDYNGVDQTVILCRSNKRANMYNQRIREHFFGRDTVLTKSDQLMIVKNNYFWLKPDSEAGFLANGDLVQVEKVNNMHEAYGFQFADVKLRLLDYPDMDSLEVKVLLDTLDSESSGLSYENYKLLFERIIAEYDLRSFRKKVEKVKQDPYYNALQIKFAYALTGHKAQGGQWKEVFVEQAVYTEDRMDLSYYKWLYTSFTRASEKLHLIGFKSSYFDEV